MKNRQHQDHLEGSGRAVEERRIFGVTPSGGWTGTCKIHDQRQNIQILGTCPAPGSSDYDGVDVDSHYSSAASGRESAEMAGIASDIEHGLRLQIGEPCLHQMRLLLKLFAGI